MIKKCSICKKENKKEFFNKKHSCCSQYCYKKRNDLLDRDTDSIRKALHYQFANVSQWMATKKWNCVNQKTNDLTTYLKRTGYVYYITCPFSGFIKVGYSDIESFETRKRAYKTHSPIDYEVIPTKGDMLGERFFILEAKKLLIEHVIKHHNPSNIHDAFAHMEAYYRGEWYSLKIEGMEQLYKSFINQTPAYKKSFKEFKSKITKYI